MQDLDRNDFFSKGGEKEFTILTPGAGSFHRSYLQVLLQSDWLFEAGISSIFHCQSKAYYDCILALAKMGATENLKNLKPHRPAAEYKQMLKMQQEPGGKANRPKGTDLLQQEEEPEPNFFCRPQETQGDAQQRVAHQKKQQTRRKKSRTAAAAAAAPSSGAKQISCSDSDASDEQDGKAAVQEGPDLPPGAVAVF